MDMSRSKVKRSRSALRMREKSPRSKARAVMRRTYRQPLSVERLDNFRREDCLELLGVRVHDFF